MPRVITDQCPESLRTSTRSHNRVVNIGHLERLFSQVTTTGHHPPSTPVGDEGREKDIWIWKIFFSFHMLEFFSVCFCGGTGSL